jgi:hypothetical protein
VTLSLAHLAPSPLPPISSHLLSPYFFIFSPVMILVHFRRAATDRCPSSARRSSPSSPHPSNHSPSSSHSFSPFSFLSTPSLPLLHAPLRRSVFSIPAPRLPHCFHLRALVLSSCFPCFFSSSLPSDSSGS